MPKAYILIQFDLSNQELFGKYIRSAAPTIKAHGGQVIVASENPRPHEGLQSTTRTTIIEFPSRETATNWLNSPEYTAVKSLRHEATTNGTLFLFDGWQFPK